MQNTAKQNKRLRQRERAEERAAARRKAEQRRRLQIILGGLAAIAIVVLAVVAIMGGGDEGAGPATAGQVTADGPPRTEMLAVGEAVPAFSAPGLAGGTVAWSDYAGAPAVLSVWAPWCPHCQVELPILDDVMREFPGVGFVTVVTAIADQPGPTPEEYMRDNDLAFPVAVDDEAGTIASSLGIEGFPTLYFVASDGAVAQVATGEMEAEELRQIVGSLT